MCGSRTAVAVAYPSVHLCVTMCVYLQVDSVYNEFEGRTVIDLGCGTVGL